MGALGAARIPPVTCRFRGPFRSSPVVLSLPLHYHIHLPSEPRDTVPAVQISFFVTLPMFNTDVYDMLD